MYFMRYACRSKLFRKPIWQYSHRNFRDICSNRNSTSTGAICSASAGAGSGASTGTGAGPAPRNNEFISSAFLNIFPWISWRSFGPKHYYFLEASKYDLLSKCSTHGCYISTKSCISKLPKSITFWGSKPPQEHRKKLEIRYYVGPEYVFLHNSTLIPAASSPWDYPRHT